MNYRPLALFAFLALVAACSSDDDGGASSSSSGGTANTSAAKACVDVADAVGKAAQRCGQDYKANYDAFIGAVANGNCNNIIGVRDEESLRQTCIPSLSTISCEDLVNAKLDASCAGQLQRPASFRPTLAPASAPASVMATE